MEAPCSQSPSQPYFHVVRRKLKALQSSSYFISLLLLYLIAFGPTELQLTHGAPLNSTSKSQILKCVSKIWKTEPSETSMSDLCTTTFCNSIYNSTLDICQQKDTVKSLNQFETAFNFPMACNSFRTKKKLINSKDAFRTIKYEDCMTYCSDKGQNELDSYCIAFANILSIKLKYNGTMISGSSETLQKPNLLDNENGDKDQEKQVVSEDEIEVPDTLKLSSSITDTVTTEKMKSQVIMDKSKKTGSLPEDAEKTEDHNQDKAESEGEALTQQEKKKDKESEAESKVGEEKRKDRNNTHSKKTKSNSEDLEPEVIEKSKSGVEVQNEPEKPKDSKKEDEEPLQKPKVKSPKNVHKELSEPEPEDVKKELKESESKDVKNEPEAEPEDVKKEQVEAEPEDVKKEQVEAEPEDVKKEQVEAEPGDVKKEQVELEDTRKKQVEPEPEDTKKKQVEPEHQPEDTKATVAKTKHRDPEKEIEKQKSDDLISKKGKDLENTDGLDNSIFGGDGDDMDAEVPVPKPPKDIEDDNYKEKEKPGKLKSMYKGNKDNEDIAYPEPSVYNKNQKQLYYNYDPTGQYEEAGNYNYFLLFVLICCIGFFGFLNKKRIIACFLEGRRPGRSPRTRSRSNSGSARNGTSYSKLENNYDD